MTLRLSIENLSEALKGTLADYLKSDDLEAILSSLEEMADSIERMVAGLPQKVDAVEGMGLSTNDFTDEYKQGLDEF